MADMIRIQQEDFDVAAEYAALRGNTSTGAVTMMVGCVRDNGDLAEVHGLHLEHYSGMTEKALASIVAEARGRWPLLAVRIVHRVGELAPGAQIVFVGVGSAHRAAAFAACEFLIDWLKTRAPFWKRETDAAGVSRWVEQKAADGERALRWQRSGENHELSVRQRTEK